MSDSAVLETEDTPAPEAGEPASWKGTGAPRRQPCSHEIKLLRPVCRECEAAVGGKRFLARNWFDSCGHDPYVSIRERKVQRPVYEDDPDTGAKRLVSTETLVITEPRPNWVSVTHGGGMNKGRGVDKALRKGYIWPQQLRSPIWPSGIKMRCQFRECYLEDLTHYSNGWFCCELEAKLVKVSDTSTTWEVGYDGRSQQFQNKILDQAAVSA